MRGLDPRIHRYRKAMDCRVKPGNDGRERGARGQQPWRKMPATPGAAVKD